MKVDYGDVGGDGVEYGTIPSPLSTTDQTRVELGYRPKMLIVRVYNSGGTYSAISMYVDDKPNEIYITRPDWTVFTTNPSSSSYVNHAALYQVDNTGFTLSKGSSEYKYNAEYWASK